MQRLDAERSFATPESPFSAAGNGSPNMTTAATCIMLRSMTAERDIPKGRTLDARRASKVGVSNRELAAGEWAVLALLCEQPGHGWALAAKLAKDGELGTVWSLGRPLVYRSLEILQNRGLVEPTGFEPGTRGPNRTIFGPTAQGRAAVEHWLSEPVEHVRDMRSLLLLKLVFASRANLDARPLLERQRELLAQAVGGLSGRAEEMDGTEEILFRFRTESSRALLRFVDGLLETATN